VKRTIWQERLKNNEWSAYFFIMPALVVILLFILYPVCWSFIVSFKAINPIQLKNSGLFSFPGISVGLDNYREILSYPLFWKSLWNTIYFGVVFIPLTMVGAVALAVLLDDKIKGNSFMRSVFFIPYIVSIISASLIFMLIFAGDRGLINGALAALGMKGPDWLASATWAMAVIALMSAWKRVGYFMVIYLGGLQNVPPELYEAGKIDGANGFQQFIYITWPLLQKINLVVFIMLLIQSLNVFQEIFVMTGGGPADSTTTVPFLIYNQAFIYYHLGKASAMSYLLFLIVLLIGAVQNKLNANKLEY
jgi:multiple sugar transport system permease protein